jgi:hypothetical protein
LTDRPLRWREGPEGMGSSEGTWRVRLLRRFPTVVGVPGLPPLGRTDAPLHTILRLRPVAPEDGLRDLREDRTHLESELEGLRGERDPRALALLQAAEGCRRLEQEMLQRTTRLWDVLLGMRQWEGLHATGPRLEETVRELEALGVRTWRSRWRARPALTSLRPGAPAPSEWFHRLEEGGLAALLPLWEDPSPDPEGPLLGAHALHGTPIYHDRFRHPHHSSAVFGETGSGKSYASGLGILRSRWAHPELSVFVLDPLGGLARLLELLGGVVLTPGGAGPSMNPLDPATTGGDRRRKMATVGVLWRSLFPSLRDEEVAFLDVALGRLYEQRQGGAPCLGDLLSALEAQLPAGHRLVSLVSQAVRGSLSELDRPTSVDLSAKLCAFDLSAVSPRELPFFLTLTLDFVEGELRHRPGEKLVVVDEAHYLMTSGSTAGFLDHLVRHVRHYRAGLELLSQSPADFLGSPAGRSILLNLDFLLLLRLKDGGRGLRPLFPLREEEMALIKGAPLPRENGSSGGLLLTGGAALPVQVIASEGEDRLLRRALAGEGNGRGS